MLPSIERDFKDYEKISTYNKLARIGCPVLKSVLIDDIRCFSENDVGEIKNYLRSDFCTVRYQYIRPNPNPVVGGNKAPLEYSALKKKCIPDAMLWILEPINRLTNEYGINVLVDNSRLNELIIEVVGRGFDGSDINRGNISPHQIFTMPLSVIYAWNGEWWKFLRVEITSDDIFQASKETRLRNLDKWGIKATKDIFTGTYKRMPFDLLKKLLDYCKLVCENIDVRDEIVVACSVDENMNFVFWDIATQAGKMKILAGGHLTELNKPVVGKGEV
jgi:hypothetical protein